MYWGEQGTEMGTNLIAEEIGCSQSTVYYYLEKYGIETRGRPGIDNSCMTEKSKLVGGLRISETMKGRTQTSEHKRKRLGNQKAEKNNTSKLNHRQCLDIYLEYHKRDITQKELACKHKVSRPLICNIVNLNHWSADYIIRKTR